MSDTRKCVVCGKEYDYCPNCAKYMSLPRWMFLFCSEECKDIYETLNDFDYKKVSASEAKATLLKNNGEENRLSKLTGTFKTTYESINKEAGQNTNTQQKNNTFYNNKIVKKN